MDRSRSLQHGRYGAASTRTGTVYNSTAANSYTRIRGPDYGVDNFAFDPDYVQEWQMPDNIGHNLPESLCSDVTNWVHAGAAVCTSLARISRLYASARARVHPVVSHPHLTSRRRSEQSTTARAAVYLDSPPCSTPDSAISNDQIAPLTLDNLHKLTSPHAPQQPQLGMESPPFTPYDTQPCTTPVIPRGSTVTSPAAVDYHQIREQYSPPPSSRSSCRSSIALETSSTLGIEPEGFDEAAWETFVGACNAERFDLRQNVLSRLLGFTLIIDRTLLELANDRALDEDDRAALRLFHQWWQTRKPVVAVYENKVRSIEVPKLEEVLRKIEQDLK